MRLAANAADVQFGEHLLVGSNERSTSSNSNVIVGSTQAGAAEVSAALEVLADGSQDEWSAADLPASSTSAPSSQPMSQPMVQPTSHSMSQPTSEQAFLFSKAADKEQAVYVFETKSFKGVSEEVTHTLVASRRLGGREFVWWLSRQAVIRQSCHEDRDRSEGQHALSCGQGTTFSRWTRTLRQPLQL